MAKVDWLDEVVKVLRSTPPAFPGEVDPAFAVLDKVVNKLYSECWNGGKLGGDGCAVCRAHKTEAAEKALAVAQSSFEEACKRAETAQAAAKDAAEANAVLAQTNAKLEAFLKASQAAQADAEATAKKAVQDRDDALQERANAQRGARAAEDELESLKTYVEKLQKQLGSISDAVAQISITLEG